MGAAGYVTIYQEDEVRSVFSRLWPEYDIDEDWWYLATCSGDVFGTRLIIDYADDQGYHDGTGNEFWFNVERGPDGPNGRAEWYETPERQEGDLFLDPLLKSQRRVLTALRECQSVWIEVWT